MFAFQDLLSFEKLVTPTVIRIVYFIGLVVIALGALIGVFDSLFAGQILAALGALIATVLGFLAWRIWCELVIVLFGLYDRAGEIRDRLPTR
jgi:hypothetical protein